MPDRQDSNVVGLRIAEEATLGVLPATPDWIAYEPNSYNDFGGQITIVARNPINAARQRQKGVTTDLDASGGFNQDWVQSKLRDILQGFMFADWREQPSDIGPLVAGVAGVTFTPVTFVATDASGEIDFEVTTHTLITGDGPFDFVAGAGTLPGNITADTEYWAIRTDDDHFQVAASLALANAGTGIAWSSAGNTDAGRLMNRRVSVEAAGDIFYVNDQEDGFQEFNLIFVEGYADAANNGLHVVDSGVAVGVVSVLSALVEEAVTPVGAKVTVVGIRNEDDDVDVTAPTGGNLGFYTSTNLDFTTLGLVPGAWIFVGGDLTDNKFLASNNNGFKRVFSIAATKLEIDRGETLTDETSTGSLNVDFFVGETLKNESDPDLIIDRSYQLERTLGNDGVGIQSEIEIGARASQFQMNVTGQDKVTVDLSFMALDEEVRTGTTGVKSGNRPAIVAEEAFNTSTDFSRLKLTLDSDGSALFAFVTEFTLTVDNSLSPNKAVSVLGAFDISKGQFLVSGSITAYFADTAAKTALRNNADVSFDFALVKNNAGWLFDIPLITLGDARLNVEQDAPITLPLTMDAGKDPTFNHTFLMNNFVFLPTAAG